MVKILNPTRKHLWFGTREFMQNIPMPRYDSAIGGVGYSSQIQYLDGRTFVRRSSTSHREYEFSWNLANRAELQPIFDYAAGLYGPGPYHFIDPFSADTNVFPEWWAAPGMALDDAPVLVGDVRPQALINTDFGTRYPYRGAGYTVSPGMDRQTLWIPIPPGTTLWLGSHGPSGDGAYVQAKGFVSSNTPGETFPMTNIPLSSETRCNVNFRSDEGYVGVEVSIQGTGFLQLFGLIGQILRTTYQPPYAPGSGYGEMPYGEGFYGGTSYERNTHIYRGGFIGGQGHSGVEFKNHPSRQGYSAALDLIGSSATLIEVGGE